MCRHEELSAFSVNIGAVKDLLLRLNMFDFNTDWTATLNMARSSKSALISIQRTFVHHQSDSGSGLFSGNRNSVCYAGKSITHSHSPGI